MQDDFLHQPIPGISLTGELGNAPWEQPPQYVTLDDVVDYYSDRITESEVMKNLIDTIKRDVPLLVIADAMTRIGVMQGIHTIDTAMLVKPVLVELMIAMAEIHDVKYVIDQDDIDSQRVMPTDLVKKVVEESVTKMADTKEEVGGIVTRRKK
jgi:hypothetical protein